MNTRSAVLTLAAVAMGALAIGQVQAETIDVPNGEFNVYKPGTNYTVLATFAGAVGSFESYASGVGDNLDVIGTTGMADYADATTGTTVDFPGWVVVQGASDLSNNGVDGSTGLNVFAAWGSDCRRESAESLGNLQDGTYTLSAMVSGPVAAGPMALDLMAGGVALTPSSSVEPTGGAVGDWQEISRTYDAAAVAAYIGQPMTIVIGVQDANDLADRAVFDDVQLDVIESGPPPPAITPSSAWAIAGQHFSLTATAGGTDYQWAFNGADISGATDQVLVFDPLQETDAGTYSVTYDDGTEKAEATASYVLVVYPADTVIPLTGLIGLGLLAGACALGGASALRRKK